MIPAGQYGGGDVIVWDQGRWTLDPDQLDATASLAAGELSRSASEGKKLHGNFVLLRTDGSARSDRSKRKWLRTHCRDPAAIADWDADDYPYSVTSGRTNDEVAAGKAPTDVHRLHASTSSPISGSRPTSSPAACASRPKVEASRKAHPPASLLK